MRRVDELYMNFPFAGSRMLRDLLVAESEGIKIARSEPPKMPNMVVAIVRFSRADATISSADASTIDQRRQSL